MVLTASCLNVVSKDTVIEPYFLTVVVHKLAMLNKYNQFADFKLVLTLVLLSLFAKYVLSFFLVGCLVSDKLDLVISPITVHPLYYKRHKIEARNQLFF